MNPFEKLTESENEVLLKFPAFVSLLAANSDNILDSAEKTSAIKLSHIKTYSCDPLLADFYKEADKVFEQNILQLNQELPTEETERQAALKTELLKLEAVVLKLGDENTEVMHRSMKSFKDHVSQAHHSVLVDFIFPVPIKGLTY